MKISITLTVTMVSHIRMTTFRPMAQYKNFSTALTIEKHGGLNKAGDFGALLEHVGAKHSLQLEFADCLLVLNLSNSVSFRESVGAAGAACGLRRDLRSSTSK